MDSWTLFQLAVDIVLFAIVIVYILKDNSPSITAQNPEDTANSENRVDAEQLESLMDELARLVMRAEKAAQRIENGLKQETETLKSSAALNKQAQGKPGHDAYENAARLIKKGFSDDEIGKRVGLPASEISLIRNMAT
ncbi:hypothetical protein MNBD_NITROSPINAE04-2552 [hydrothermal vent metagenome]|uniref:DUF2802 domain-containing protein n=1 Tax=hydrothermal vent metagenome TaxID=652676 RepID=A0A3B1C1M4_9ZZZZ